MADTQDKFAKPNRPEARLPKGFRDVTGAEIRAQSRMLATLARVFETYGYEPLETSAIEYTEALGKFLPDADRPNAGVHACPSRTKKGRRRRRSRPVQQEEIAQAGWEEKEARAKPPHRR